MQKDKKRLLIVGVVMTALLVVVTFFYVYGMINNKEVTFGGIIPVLIPLIIVIFMVFFIARRYKDIKEGMPLEDERSRKVVTNAAAKAFQFSLYWLLTISIFESFFARVLFNSETLDAGQTVGGGIAGMALLFFGFWVYYNKKSELV